MSKPIKTRTVIKDIKVLDRRAAGLNGVREAYAKAKELAETDAGDEGRYRDGSDYAQSKSEQAVQTGAKAAGRGAVSGGRKAGKEAYGAAGEVRRAVKEVKRIADANRQAAKEAREAQRQAARAASGNQSAKATPATPGQAAQRTVARGRQTAAATDRQAVASAAQRQAATRRANATSATSAAKANSRQAAKGTVKQASRPEKTVKTATKSVKTAKSLKTTKTAVKTSGQVAQRARAATRAAQAAAQSAARAARAAARATATAVKALARGTAAFVKGAIAAIQSLASAIAAGGWVAVVIIVIICLVALIAGSAFGIFFAGEDMGDGNPALREVVAQIEQEYQVRIDEIRTDSPHDDLMLSGARAPWPEVLAVYAVRVTTDSDEPLDAITLDERRQQVLQDVFGNMNAIEYRTEDREVTEIIAVEGADGTITEQTQTHTRRTLYITQMARAAGEAAVSYGFTQAQHDLLAQLLEPANDSMWQTVLYDIHAGSGDIVEVAASQIGNGGGQPYWSWYGFSSRVEWCACFVSWCANETGHLEAGTIPRFSYVPTGIQWFRDAGRFRERGSGYVPRPGDIIFFDWEQDGTSDHTGIVESSDGITVRTIEGNSSDAVRRSRYEINSTVIYGFGTVGV
jgi:cell wall-associated NlpC family hydrolase